MTRPARENGLPGKIGFIGCEAQRDGAQRDGARQAGDRGFGRAGRKTHASNQQGNARQARNGHSGAGVNLGGPRAIGSNPRDRPIARLFDKPRIGRRGKPYLRQIDDESAGRGTAPRTNDFDTAPRSIDSASTPRPAVWSMHLGAWARGAWSQRACLLRNFRNRLRRRRALEGGKCFARWRFARRRARRRKPDPGMELRCG
jgi:hypothetical protein